VTYHFPRERNDRSRIDDGQFNIHSPYKGGNNMGLLLLLFAVFFLIIWLIYKKYKKSHKKIEPLITIQTDFHSRTSFQYADTGDIKSSEDGGWIINPRSTFPLTFYGINEKEANELKMILEEGFTKGIYDILPKLIPSIASLNLKCKEIDEYVKKYKPLYLKKIEELKNASLEWPTLSDNDKEDLLFSFRKTAIDSLDVRPNCNLEYLFEYEPSDISFDDLLLERYGYDLMQFYISRADRLDKVYIIPAEHYYRKYFERLVEKKLAIRGADIPINLILNALTLKEINEIISDLNMKPFKRKNKAVEYLLTVPDIQERLKSKMAFRELFKLSPLPAEFNNINLEDISKAWKYATEVATLLIETYIRGGYAKRDFLERKKYLDTIKSWGIMTTGEDACPYCKRLALKEFPKDVYPRVPLHIGCRCLVLFK